MRALIAGLLLFFAAHSTRIFADGWRTRQIARFGAHGWKGLYSIASLLGFGLIVWGYGQARLEPSFVWIPPHWTRHVTALLTLPAFVLLAAAYVPGNRIKAALGHPMVLGIQIWALAHLLANGRLADVILFGAFLVWAVLSYKAARARDRHARTRYEVLPGRDAVVVAGGLLAWALFAFALHRLLIGVAAFG